MGQIVIMQDKIEVQVIETPDYTPLLNEIDCMSRKKEVTENLANEVMEVNCDNIIDQIVAYVTMTMRPMLPILQYTNRFRAISGCFDVYAERENFVFDICANTKRIIVHIFDDTLQYTTDERDKLTPCSLSRIAADWPDFKEELKRQCEYASAGVRASLKCTQQDNEKYINNISNFKL